MSSSEDESRPILGSARVIMGLGSAGPQETTVAAIESERAAPSLEEVERRFMERVRGRAEDKAKEIIARALTEAESIREKAAAEGYEQGATRYAEDYQAHVRDLSAAVAETLDAVQRERKTLWAGYRADFTALLRLAVEKTIGAELDARRDAVVAALLDEALDLIDSRASLTVRVHPDLAPLLADLLERAKAGGARLERWQIKGDPNIQAGGLILESAEGMVDNTLESRWAEVETIFGRLAIDEPESESGGVATGDAHES